jgi:SAM-dependent methyltransferase
MTEQSQKSNDQIREEWTIGSYPTLASEFLPLAAELVDSADVGPGDRVLDVACGTGNVALTAHRRGAEVTGVDITPAMLEMARERSATIDADVEWREGDATALPFDDDSFDVTLSCLGHMFAEDPEAAGSELLRVTEPGGRVAYISWTLEGALTAMLRALVEYLPSPPETPPPALWGDPDTVRDRIGDRVEDLRFETGTNRYSALSPSHFWSSLRRDSGAVQLMVDEVDEEDLPSLHEAAVEAIEPFFDDERNEMQLEYRLVTGTIR